MNRPARKPIAVRSCRRRRRGVLMLVVLSMLTLFLMLGAAYIVTATRAREAARAYSRLTFGGDEARVPHARLLDGVLLRVVRGGTTPPLGPGGLPVPFESLLADKYGTGTCVATASGFAPVLVGGVPAAVLTGTLTLSGTTLRPTDLNGRLVTLADPGRPATTHRIIRAQGIGITNAPASAFTVAVGIPTGPEPFVRPKATCRAIVNGREFDASSANEAWDGFDVQNVFLAQVQPGRTIATSTVSRISFAPSSFNAASLSAAYDYDGDLVPDAADNDNDGIYDGLFLDFGIPDARDANGNPVRVRASVLIVDLDGRFNVNAHDSLPRLIYAGTANWPVDMSGSARISGSVPMGSGYGPAEVNGMSGTRAWTSGSTWQSGIGMFSGSTNDLHMSPTFATSENPTVFALTGGPGARMIGQRPSGSRYSSGTSTPTLLAVEGKYGEKALSDWTSIIPDDLAGSKPFAVPGQPAVNDEASRISDRRASPAQASNVSYGVPPVWWTGTASGTFNWAVSPTVSGVAQPLPRGTFNSPPDLHGRMRIFTGTAAAIVPQLLFAKAEWSGTSAGASRESADDPYELRVDTRCGFGGLLFDPTAGGTTNSPSSVLRDNPFTAAELEPVLRPYDIDSNRLPPRLPAMLGSVGEEGRLKITTDSWDTTAITGTAAAAVAAWLTSATTGSLYGTTATSGIIGGEVSRGERFDLNRPLAAADGSNTGYPAGALAASPYHLQRAAYCKDLYTLLLALAPSVPPPDLAQWAANVAEWRDADSRVMPFEYDTNPLNGWNVDGDVRTNEGGDRAVVWGAERPEILIQEALAWRNAGSRAAGGFFTLHRPWNATAYASGSTASIAAEPCDYALDTLNGGSSGRPQNVVNLGKKSSADLYSGTNARYVDVSGTSTYPIWRLRIVAGGSTSYVRFDTSDTTRGDIVDPSITSGDTTPRLGVDSTITFVSGSTIVTGSDTMLGSVSLNAQDARSMPALRALGSGSSATVFLERLSDPSSALTPAGVIPGTTITGSAVWFGTAPNTTPVQYLVVDSAAVVTNDSSTAVNFNGSKAARKTNGTASDFWLAPTPTPVSAANGASITVPAPLASGSTAWLPWPNRPFVSSAELMLVPQGDSMEILQNYQTLTPAVSGTVRLGNAAPVPLALLLDAVQVPTRFAGIHRTFTQNLFLSGTTGIDNTVSTVNQLSSFREPGRVNLNTVPAEDVWQAVVAGPLSQPIKSSTAAGFATSPGQSLAALLSLAGGTGGVPATDTDSNLPAARNPLHGIYTATRLANTVTPRSNVFAVWITLRESVANDPDSVRYRRAFYIVDRSIPVGYEPEKDLNVWDCVRVRRIIE